MELNRKSFLVVATLWPSLVVAQNSISSPFTVGQLSAARDLLLSLSRSTDTPGVRSCGYLPKNPMLLDELKFNSNQDNIQVPGLTNGLKVLPTALVRFAYCIPEPPNRENKEEFGLWLNIFNQEVSNSSLRFLVPNGGVSQGFPESLLSMGKYRPHLKIDIQPDTHK